MKDKAYNSRGRIQDEITQALNSYSDYAFPNDETHCPHCKNASSSVLCTPTHDECQSPNWKFLLQKFTASTSVALSGVGRYSSS